MNNRGMTLVEVILSIMLIGIISVVFLPSIITNFNMLINTKKFTTDSFEAQEDIEKLMEEARKSGKESEAFDKIELEAFNKKVHGYKIEKAISNHGKINVFIADTRPPESEVPIVEEVWIEGKKNGRPIDYIYGADKDTYIEGNYIIDQNTKHNLLSTVQKWYVSEEGFYPIIPKEYPELEVGVKYPIFPQNYEPIRNEYKKTLNNLDRFSDRHIIYTLTPISKVGKYGKEVYSNSLYVIGIPVVDDLSLHLDSSFIILEDNRFKEWIDLSGIHNPAKQIKTQKPISVENGILKTNGSGLEIKNNNILNSEKMTMFIVVKNTHNDEQRFQNIISKYTNSKKQGWSVELDSSKVKFTFMGKGLNGEKLNKILISNTIENDKKIITIGFDENILELKLNGDKIIEEDKDFNNSINNEPIIIGGDSSYLNIYEILIFNRKLSEAEQRKVEDYLKIKHFN